MLFMGLQPRLPPDPIREGRDGILAGQTALRPTICAARSDEAFCTEGIEYMRSASNEETAMTDQPWPFHFVTTITSSRHTKPK